MGRKTQSTERSNAEDGRSKLQSDPDSSAGREDGWQPLLLGNGRTRGDGALGPWYIILACTVLAAAEVPLASQ